MVIPLVSFRALRDIAAHEPLCVWSLLEEPDREAAWSEDWPPVGTRFRTHTLDFEVTTAAE